MAGKAASKKKATPKKSTKKSTEKNLGGRPKIEWSEQQYKTFEGLCAIQATVEEIENVLDIDHKTIDRLCKERYKDCNGNPMNYSQAYAKFSSTGKMSLRRQQYKAAEAGNTSMLIWLGKQYLGQKEQQEVSVPDGNITFNIKPASERPLDED